ncbi:hypothetical protein OGAPHI_004815 [Ogataea philodendri]|uniref:Uncharacterized protein n=1 Tax=Ogataea philodendri TaxID=1378263 RepID=A0A9P8T3R8_9ASCO|nr:uncharacterized protein OGAPHI_004815 [Ogataea philodendri]KAH3664101.1 hypothetical protein OGAPHI_004815 [Ogataea philodendri]
MGNTVVRDTNRLDNASINGLLNGLVGLQSHLLTWGWCMDKKQVDIFKSLDSVETLRNCLFSFFVAHLVGPELGDVVNILSPVVGRVLANPLLDSLGATPLVAVQNCSIDTPISSLQGFLDNLGGVCQFPSSQSHKWNRKPIVQFHNLSEHDSNCKN